MNHLPDDSLKPEFEESAIMDFEQPVRDVNSVIRVDADTVGVEGGMADLRPVTCSATGVRPDFIQ